MKGRITKTGYRRNSPDVNNDFNIIPSNRISMKGVDFPVFGVDNMGNSQMMYPGGEYEYQGDYVTELPAYGSGGLTQWFAEKWVDIKTGKKCGRSGKDKKGRPYPACRPSKRVNKTTPKTKGEMSASEKAKFKRKKKSGKRIDYNHKRAQFGGRSGDVFQEVDTYIKPGQNIRPNWAQTPGAVTNYTFGKNLVDDESRFSLGLQGTDIFDEIKYRADALGSVGVGIGNRKGKSFRPAGENLRAGVRGQASWQGIPGNVIENMLGRRSGLDWRGSVEGEAGLAYANGAVRPYMSIMPQTNVSLNDNLSLGIGYEMRGRYDKNFNQPVSGNSDTGTRVPVSQRDAYSGIGRGAGRFSLNYDLGNGDFIEGYYAKPNTLYQGSMPGIPQVMALESEGPRFGVRLRKSFQPGGENDATFKGALDQVDITFDRNTGENILNDYPYYNQLSATDRRYFNDGSAIGRGVRRRARVGDQSLYGELESGAKNILNTAAEYSGLAGSARFVDDPKGNLIGAGKAVEKFMLGTNPMASSFLNTEITPEQSEQFFNTVDFLGLAGAATAPLKPGITKAIQTGIKNPGRMATNRIAKATMPMYKEPYRALDLDGASSFVTKKPMTFTHVSKNPALQFDDIKTTEPVPIGRRSRGGKRINRKVKAGDSDPRNALSGFYTTSKEAGVRSSPAGILRPGQSSYKFKMPEGSKVLELSGTSNMSTGNMQEALDMGYDFIKGNDFGTGVEYLPLNKSKMQGFYKEGVEAELARRASKQPLALPEPITYYRATTPEKFSGIMNPISTSGKAGSKAENLRFFTPNKNVASSYLNKEGVGVTARMNIKKPFIQEQNRILTNEFIQNLMDQGYDAIQTLPFDGSKNLRDAFEVVPLNKNILSDLKQAKFQPGGEQSILPPAIRNMYPKEDPKEDPINYGGMLAETTVRAARPTEKPGFMDFVNYLRQTGEGIPEASPYHYSHSPTPINANQSFIGADKSGGLRALKGLAKGIKKGVNLIKGVKGTTDDVAKGFNYRKGVGNPYENMKVNDDLFSGRHDYGVDYDGQIEIGRLGFVRNLGKELDDINFDANWIGPEHLRFHGSPYGRSVVEVAVPGKTHQTQLFYKSSGLAGKAGEGVKGTTQAMWQPYGGHATKLDVDGPVHEWFIKGEDYKTFYNSKSFRDIAGRLDDLTKEAGFDMSGQAYKYQQGGEQSIQVPKRNGVRKNSDGTVSTHLMATETLDGKNWVSFPTLFQNEDSTWVDMSDKPWMDAYKEASKRGEVIDFGTSKERAIDFGNGSWKKQQGGQQGPPYMTEGPIQELVYPGRQEGPQDVLTENISRTGKLGNATKSGAPSVDVDRLKKGIKYAESLGGKLMMNPESSATGFYGQLFSEIDGKDFLQGITRQDFANDTTLQNKVFDERLAGNEGLFGKKTGLVQDGLDLYNEYKPQLGDKLTYTPTEIAALTNMLGRQGTREYLGYVLRDGKSLEEALPKLYGSSAKYKNKTPEQYISKFNEAFGDGGESIPVYNTYNTKNRAWLAARKNLGPGKKFMYGGKVYSTNTPKGL